MVIYGGVTEMVLLFLTGEIAAGLEELGLVLLPAAHSLVMELILARLEALKLACLSQALVLEKLVRQQLLLLCLCSRYFVCLPPFLSALILAVMAMGIERKKNFRLLRSSFGLFVLSGSLMLLIPRCNGLAGMTSLSFFCSFSCFCFVAFLDSLMICPC